MLRGSTLAETLVMMLVAGIVFLAAMEAQLGLPRMATANARHLLQATLPGFTNHR